MEVSNEVLGLMVAYLEKSSEILDKAASQETDVANKAPSVVDQLIKAGQLDPESRNRAIQSIQNPLTALESLVKLASTMQKEASSVGSLGRAVQPEPSNTKEASMSEADVAFLTRLRLI